MDPADYVLRDFSKVEQPEISVVLEEAADAVVDVVVNGFDKAQMVLHTDRSRPT